MKVAIIDLGSNSARMNIVEIENGDFKVLHNIRTVVRLSEGMGDELTLKPNAIKRTLDVLKDFKRIIDEEGVQSVRAIATAALRTAVNKEALTEPLKEIGIDFEIITGEKEAYYDYMSVVSTLDIKNCLIIDIGGASTELICIKDGVNTNAVSIPMAAVNMTEKYFLGNIAEDNELETAENAFTEQLKKLDWLDAARGFDIVGLGGTIRALARIECADDELLHGYTMNKKFVFDSINRLVKMPYKDRVAIPGLGTGRADIILGGVVPLMSVMNYIDSKRLITCVVGLREGVMYDIIKK